ncbi:MAG TPA: amino acid permease [Candidatus Kapabacteria bacterium]|nr:amino acid permease [Candidatus Kapabacteria bacterium]
MQRSLSLFDSTMLVIGSMVGSGIFIVSADISRQVGSPFLLLLAWALTGVITLIAALSYGELAGMMPSAGGQYVYLREAYNNRIAFLYGWTLFLVIQTGTIAAVAVAFAKFTAVFFPAVSENSQLFSLPLGQSSFTISGAQILAVISIWVLTLINIRGVQAGKIVQNIFTSSKSLALAFVILLGIIIGSNANAINANFGDNFFVIHGDASHLDLWSLFLVFCAALVGSIFSSDAWNNITFTAGEVRNPKRTIPLSLAIGTGIVTLLYITANISYLMVLPLQGDAMALDVIGKGIQYAVNDRVGTAAISVILGNNAVLVMAALIMVSTFGCNNGLILSGARAYYAMAKDALFFKQAAELNKQGVPQNALIIQAIWASLLCLSGGYGALLDYVVFAVLLFYILTIAGIFILRKKQPSAERPYKAFGYPILPGLYIVLASIIALVLLFEKSDTSLPGLFIVLLGIPVYEFMKRR